MDSCVPQNKPPLERLSSTIKVSTSSIPWPREQNRISLVMKLPRFLIAEGVTRNTIDYLLTGCRNANAADACGADVAQSMLALC